MLRMVIVEDERLEREGLVEFFDWNIFGIEIVGTASDGIEGIELIEKKRPDIVITDIKMPGMNGIEMCKEIRSFSPNAKIIILSGHNDFNYAKEAIGFRANAYVLKPIIDEEIISTIKDVVNECLNERKKIEEEIYTKEKLMKEYDNSRSKFFIDLMEGALELKELEERIKDYGIKVNDKNWFVVFELKAADVLSYDSDKLQTEFMDKIKKCVIFSEQRAQQKIRVICQFSKKRYEIEVNDFMNLLSKLFYQNIFNGTAAIGCEVDSLYEIDKSYSCAKETLKYAMFWGMSGIINYKDIAISSNVANDRIGEFIVQGNKFSKLLVHAVSSSDIEKVNDILKEMFDYINDNREIGIDYIKNYIQNVVYEMTLIEYNIDRKGDSKVRSDGVAALDTLKSIQEYMQETANNVISILEDKRNNKDENVIKSVVKLIEEKYMDDINLRFVASEVFFSPNYLGSIFKKHIGKSFNDYLSEYRMEKAKERLSNANKKISEVAREVGIPNTSYFSILFKNFYGMTPKEYQDMIIRR